MAKGYAGKVVWITGGGSGIGAAMAVEAARRGARVAVSGRRRHKLEGVVETIEAAGGEGLVVPCDVTVEAQVERAVDRVCGAWGGALDVAVANAGFSIAGKLEELTAADWRRQLEVNVIGCAVTAREALPALRRSRGRLALVGSVMGTLPLPGYGAYAASKYAVRAVGQTLSMELAGSGVSCTTVQPGFVETEIAQVDNQGRFREDWRDGRPGPLVWPADRAARVILDAIWDRQREFTFTGHGKLGAFLGRHAPGLVHAAVVGLNRVGAGGLL